MRKYLWVFGLIEGSSEWLGAAATKATAVEYATTALDEDIYGMCRDEDWTEELVVRASKAHGEFLVVMKHQRGWAHHEHYAVVRRLNVSSTEGDLFAGGREFTAVDPVDGGVFTLDEADILGMSVSGS